MTLLLETTTDTCWNDPATNNQFVIPAGTPCEYIQNASEVTMTIAETEGFKRQFRKNQNLVLVSLKGKFRALDRKHLKRTK